VPSLACIIPVVGSTEGLETTLVSVLERRPDTCEVFVVLNVPYHDPYHLQGEIQILQAPARAGIVDCVNIGILATTAPIIHILSPDSEVTPGWIERALARFDDPRVAAVAPAIYNREHLETLLAAGATCGRGGRRIVHREMSSGNVAASLGPTLQAAFYRKSALSALGGCLTTAVGDDLADLDVSMSLARAGWHMGIEPECRILGAAGGDLRPGGFEYGLCSERLYWRHFVEMGGVGGLFSHMIAALHDLLRSNPIWKAPAQLLGRMVAVCQLGHYRQYRQMLVAARRDAAAAEVQRQSLHELAETKSGSPADKSHRVDLPHHGIKIRDTSRQRQTYRRKKQR
jgi:GT2 family glycosyltransferase